MRTRCRLALVGLLLIAAGAAGCGGGEKPTRKEFDLAFRGGALPAEQQLIRVRQGDDVILRWSTDEPLEIHLHGYDVHKELKPGSVTTMWFVATATGRFPITRHRHGGEEATLAYLEVHPR
jgi:hypothetical protein